MSETEASRLSDHLQHYHPPEPVGGGCYSYSQSRITPPMWLVKDGSKHIAEVWSEDIAKMLVAALSAASTLDGYNRLERIRYVGWTYSVVAFPPYRYSHEHYYVRASERDNPASRYLGVGPDLNSAIANLGYQLPRTLQQLLELPERENCPPAMPEGLPDFVVLGEWKDEEWERRGDTPAPNQSAEDRYRYIRGPRAHPYDHAAYCWLRPSDGKIIIFRDQDTAVRTIAAMGPFREGELSTSSAAAGIRYNPQAPQHDRERDGDRDKPGTTPHPRPADIQPEQPDALRQEHADEAKRSDHA
jgi:hypothetical protein